MSGEPVRPASFRELPGAPGSPRELPGAPGSLWEPPERAQKTTLQTFFGVKNENRPFGAIFGRVWPQLGQNRNQREKLAI